MPTSHALSASWSEEEKICQGKKQEEKKKNGEKRREKDFISRKMAPEGKKQRKVTGAEGLTP